MSVSSRFRSTTNRDPGWYDLFSRGARDWLRHNEKVREAVRDRLSELISQANIVDDDGQRRVQVPVKFLEHYRFRLSDDGASSGAGQGDVKPGDVLKPARGRDKRAGEDGGGNESGGVEFVLELAVDDIVDWLWEELELPNLVKKTGDIERDEFHREGWSRRGVRSRLDRRRSLKESIKRRSVQKSGPAITDDDLRFRQLVQREQPSCNAVVFFLMDVSASMSQRDRRLAKTFFFWVVQGLRRQYVNLNCEFIAHTDEAWKFSEQEFFQVKGSGGTMASYAFGLVETLIADEYDPSNYNIYLFYASDGDNYPGDNRLATTRLRNILQLANFGGLVQTAVHSGSRDSSEMAEIFTALAAEDLPASSYFLHAEAEVWEAIKKFFRQSSAAFEG